MALWAWNTALNWLILKECKSKLVRFNNLLIIVNTLKDKMISSMYGEDCTKEAFKDEMRVLVKHSAEHLQELKNNDQYTVPKEWRSAPKNTPIFSVLFHKDRFEVHIGLSI